MHNRGLAFDYVHRAAVRLQALDVLFEAESWPDVVREAQEVVELALKGLLRSVGVVPPGSTTSRRSSRPSASACPRRSGNASTS